MVLPVNACDWDIGAELADPSNLLNTLRGERCPTELIIEIAVGLSSGPSTTSSLAEPRPPTPVCPFRWEASVTTRDLHTGAFSSRNRVTARATRREGDVFPPIKGSLANKAPSTRGRKSAGYRGSSSSMPRSKSCSPSLSLSVPSSVVSLKPSDWPSSQFTPSRTPSRFDVVTTMTCRTI